MKVSASKLQTLQIKVGNFNLSSKNKQDVYVYSEHYENIVKDILKIIVNGIYCEINFTYI